MGKCFFSFPGLSHVFLRGFLGGVFLLLFVGEFFGLGVFVWLVRFVFLGVWGFFLMFKLERRQSFFIRHS